MRASQLGNGALSIRPRQAALVSYSSTDAAVSLIALRLLTTANV